MKKHIVNLTFINILAVVILLTGCKSQLVDNERLPGDNPPPVQIEVNGKIYDTTLGAYCWGPDEDGYHECADTGGPEELLSDAEPIKVTPRDEITIIMDYAPLPNKIYLTQIVDGETESIRLDNSKFKAPTEKGLYYYEYAVWWMDEDDSQLSLGDAFYAFVIVIE